MAIVLLAFCLAAWTVVRMGIGLGESASAQVTLSVIEWFGWTAISLGTLYLAVLLVRAFLTVRRGGARATILAWIALLVLGGLAFWNFDGVRIAAIGIHAGVLDMAITRDQAFQLSARLYPLSPYIGVQTVLMPEPVWAFWHAGRMVSGIVLWSMYLALVAIAVIATVRWRGKDLLSWLLTVPSAAGLGYLFLQTVDRPSAYALVAPWLSMKPGPGRAEMLASNFLTVTAATLSLIAGLQIYRLIRSAGLNGRERDVVRKPAPPHATTVFLLACLLIPFADLYGQFDLVLKNREIVARAELLKNAKELRIRGQSREVRARPEPEAPVIGTLAKGTKVPILETRGDWRRIADGQWVNLSADALGAVSARPSPTGPKASGHQRTGVQETRSGRETRHRRGRTGWRAGRKPLRRSC